MPGDVLRSIETVHGRLRTAQGTVLANFAAIWKARRLQEKRVGFSFSRIARVSHG